MICFKCDSGQEAAFSQEIFPCGHCDEENVVEYNICPSCGWMWRSVNGIPLEGSEIHAQDLGDFADLLMAGTDESFDNDDLTPEEQAIMENINEHLVKVDKMGRGEASMGDYIHKCLQCNSTAVDVSAGKYTCMDCSFEWEVVKFE